MRDKAIPTPEALHVTSRNGNMNCSYSTQIPTLVEVIAKFEATLPGWWWATETCSISQSASCGPNRNGRDAYLLFLDDRSAAKLFDEGFHADLDAECSTVTQALLDVMAQALESKATHGGGAYTWPVR